MSSTRFAIIAKANLKTFPARKSSEHTLPASMVSHSSMTCLLKSTKKPMYCNFSPSNKMSTNSFKSPRSLQPPASSRTRCRSQRP